MSEYKTILNPAQGTVVEKKSKFIANIKHVETQEEATEFISAVKAHYYDARHNVFAYILKENNLKRYSDDGEPQGTSGIPSLTVLEGEGLSDVCVVITRYFGGTLLGTGGLVRAYSGAVKEAIQNAEVVYLKECSVLKIVCDYTLWGKTENYITNSDAALKNTEFSNNVTAEILVSKEDADGFLKKLEELTNAAVKTEITGSVFAPFKEDGNIVK